MDQWKVDSELILTISVFPILSHVDKSKNKLALTNDVPLIVRVWPMTA